MGGLNYQIEHHLFPRMASPNLRKVQPLVREFCAERGITYTETGLIQSWGIVIRYLNRVGLGYSDPMDCPVISQFRPR
jgi:fatty acid desaturase